MYDAIDIFFSKFYIGFILGIWFLKCIHSLDACVVLWSFRLTVVITCKPESLKQPHALKMSMNCEEVHKLSPWQVLYIIFALHVSVYCELICCLLLFCVYYLQDVLK